MYYIYVLLSLKDNQFYTGYTENLKSRFEKHSKGYVATTKERRPLKLVYYEACLNQEDALHRERYLKTTWGKRYLKNRLKSLIKSLEVQLNLTGREGWNNKHINIYLEGINRPQGEIRETKHHLKMAFKKNYINKVEYTDLINRYDEFGRMLTSLEKSLEHWKSIRAPKTDNPKPKTHDRRPIMDEE